MIWPMIELKSVSPACSSSRELRDDDVVWHLGLEQIERDTGRILTRTRKPVSEAGVSTTVFDERHVLYSKLRPYLNKVICPNEPGISTTELVPLLPLENVLDRSYLMYYLRSNAFLRFSTQTVAGVKMPRVIMDKLWKHAIPLPPLSEQRRIVEILDQADALRQQRRAADEKAQRILPALFYKMFGDPVAFVARNDGIPISELNIDMQNGFACGEKDVQGGVPHLRMNNIDDEGVLNLDLVRTVPQDRDVERYRLADRDVIFMGTNSQDKIGKTCLFVPPDHRAYLFSNHLIRLRVADKRITPEYLAGFLHLLWSNGYFPSIAKRWVNQSSVPQSALANVRVPVPPEDDLNVFTRAFTNSLDLREIRLTCCTKISRTFSILLHRAFTGELTAKWRKANKEKLEAEQRDQLAALKRENSKAPKKRGRKKKAVGT